MSPPDRLRALLAEPEFIVMPAVWDGLSAKLAAKASQDFLLSGAEIRGAKIRKHDHAEGRQFFQSGGETVEQFAGALQCDQLDQRICGSRWQWSDLYFDERAGLDSANVRHCQ